MTAPPEVCRYVRLPAAPLLEAIRAERAARGVAIRRFLTPALLSARKLAMAEGSLTAFQVQRLCAAINRCPHQVYGAAYNAAVSTNDAGTQVLVVRPDHQRLPSAPLVEAIQARLRRHTEGSVPLTEPGPARVEAVREVFGDDQGLLKAFQRARLRGWVRLRAAEQLCGHFGWHPRELWGDRYDAAALAGLPEDFDPWQGVA